MFAELKALKDSIERGNNPIEDDEEREDEQEEEEAASVLKAL